MGRFLGKFALWAALYAGIWTGALSVAQSVSPELEKAEDLYRRTEYDQSLLQLKANHGSAAALNLAGRDYYMLGNFDKAVDAFEKSVKAEPGNSSYGHWLGRAWGRKAETAMAFRAPGYASKARQWFEKAAALDPRNREALSDLFEYYLEAPGFLGGGYDKALNVARQLAAIDPAEGYLAGAKLAEKKSDYAAAEQQLRRAIDAAPKQVDRTLALAKFLAKRGRQQESVAAFAQAEKIAPGAPQVWYAKADAFIKEKRNLDQAKQLLERYLRSSSITPDDPSRDDAQRLLKQTVSGA